MSHIRMTDATVKVLSFFLSSAGAELSGADFLNQMRIFSGTLYPILRRLEDAGWLSSRWEDVAPEKVKRPRRRLYKLTSIGRAEALRFFQKAGASEDKYWTPPKPIFEV